MYMSTEFYSTTMVSPPLSKRQWPAYLALSLDILSLVFNILPILVVYKLKRRNKRLATDILIAALSLTDQLCIIVPLFVTLIARFGTNNQNVCKSYYLFVFWFQNTAMLVVMTLSCERFLGVVFPFKYKTWSSQKRTYLTVLGLYIFTFIIAVLTISELGNTSTVDEATLRVCKSWLLLVYSKKAFPSVLILEGWVSMLIVLICNISLISHLLRYKRMLEIGNSSVGLSRQHLRDFTKMVILITILFYITWLPVLCVMTLVQFGINIRQSVASLCIMATSINGFVNPFVYLTLSKQYRNGYIILMAAMCKRLGIRMRCFGSDLSVLSSSTYQTTRKRESTRRQPELEENLFANNVTNL